MLEQRKGQSTSPFNRKLQLIQSFTAIVFAITLLARNHITDSGVSPGFEKSLDISLLGERSHSRVLIHEEVIDGIIGNYTINQTQRSVKDCEAFGHNITLYDNKTGLLEGHEMIKKHYPEGYDEFLKGDWLDGDFQAFGMTYINLFGPILLFLVLSIIMILYYIVLLIMALLRCFGCCKKKKGKRQQKKLKKKKNKKNKMNTIFPALMKKANKPTEKT